MLEHLDRVEKEREEDRRDAARYRWLRNGGWEVMHDPKYWTPENRFDGAIDAGMMDVAIDAAKARAAKLAGD